MNKQRKSINRNSGAEKYNIWNKKYLMGGYSIAYFKRYKKQIIKLDSNQFKLSALGNRKNE